MWHGLHPKLRASLILIWGLMLFGWPLSTAGAAPSADGKSAESLLGVMRQIDDLRMALSRKRQRAEQIQAYLRSKQDNLAEEMRQRLRILGTGTYALAMKDERIRFDLRLYGYLTAYRDILTERITALDLGDHRLAFYFDRTDDDLRMAQTLNGLALGKITAEIALALDNTKKAVETPLIDVQKVKPLPDKKLWRRIVSTESPSAN